jgi:beta-mannosidase
MKQLTLNGVWKLKSNVDSEWLDASVPGSVFNDLLQAEKIEDPFYRDNEEHAKDIMLHDYSYTREFHVDNELLSCDELFLVCEGLDTLCEIYINSGHVAATNNMHRTYEFDVRPFLIEGDNTITIVFRSSLKYIEDKQKEIQLWGPDHTIAGFPHIRKAHYMFGWDWGPQIPDAGIWRDLYIKGYNGSRLKDVYITQTHQLGTVDLDIRVDQQKWTKEPNQIEVKMTSPDGKVQIASLTSSKESEHIQMHIESAQLWWPNGYGTQPLYHVEVYVKKEGIVLDQKWMNIGLRTITIKREKDQWGESFEFEINGTSIFAKGANYIPEDNVIIRSNPERTETLIRDCVDANFNCIRVWGGGFYPNDEFFDLCDRYGLMVWQDFMFACGVYEMNEEFTENIKLEAIDNIRRIRHHASLGLWCGNNEMEEAWVHWDFPKTEKLRDDYLLQFEKVLSSIAEEYDPNTFYWPASPSSGGGFDSPNDENRGDVHYWQVWHGLKPFTEYRKFYFRFCSEFGFQSFPGLKTIESFTLPEDRNIFSYVMERHQKNDGANGKILYYLSQNFKYPKDFSSLIYASQILQAEAMKYGVEHWRRHMDRCMGSIYWQLNDCWPVASWSSIDYYGRWKALHYFAKRFYAPVLLSACENGKSVDLYVSNDRLEPVKGTITWKLRDDYEGIIQQGSQEVSVNANSAQNCIQLNFDQIILSKEKMRTAYLEYRLTAGSECLSDGVLLFVPVKHFELKQPNLLFFAKEVSSHFEINLHSEHLTKYVEIELKHTDCKFSDNYFDLCPGEEKTIIVKKQGLTLTLDQLVSELTIRSAYDIA